MTQIAVGFRLLIVVTEPSEEAGERRETHRCSAQSPQSLRHDACPTNGKHLTYRPRSQTQYQARPDTKERCTVTKQTKERPLIHARNIQPKSYSKLELNSSASAPRTSTARRHHRRRCPSFTLGLSLPSAHSKMRLSNPPVTKKPACRWPGRPVPRACLQWCRNVRLSCLAAPPSVRAPCCRCVR